MHKRPNISGSGTGMSPRCSTQSPDLCLRQQRLLLKQLRIVAFSSNLSCDR